MINQSTPQKNDIGRKLALATSIAIITCALLLLLSSLVSSYLISIQHQSPSAVLTSIVPAIVWLAILSGIGGIAGSVVTLASYGYRARWFWRCLILGMLLLLLWVPIGTVAGLVGLTILLWTQRAFPKHQSM